MRRLSLSVRATFSSARVIVGTDSQAQWKSDEEARSFADLALECELSFVLVHDHGPRNR
jgi:hypothetical protein